MWVRRIVRHTHRIHIHFFHQACVLVAQCLTGSTARGWPNAMAIGTFQTHFDIIDIQAITFAQFNRAKANRLSDAMQGLIISNQRELNLIALGILCRPRN